jgi:hypothetical protein
MDLVRPWKRETVPNSESTCWTVIRAAAAGSPADREELARRYFGVAREYLAARWRGRALRDDLDDATQEVFVETPMPWHGRSLRPRSWMSSRFISPAHRWNWKRKRRAC